MNSSSPSSTPQRYLQRICSSSVIRIGIALVLVALVATLACVDTTVAFRACFGTLLALFGCAQIYMAVKLILDGDLFAPCPPRPDCPICFLALPYRTCTTYQSCCGKTLCDGCIHAHRNLSIDYSCPFCRAPCGKVTDKERIKMNKKRIEFNDKEAMYMMAAHYHDGSMGLKQDREKSFELFCRAAELGSSAAHHTVGLAYSNGVMGVKKDEKKAMHHLRLAAIGGMLESRYVLGVQANQNQAGSRRNGVELAMKHWVIAAEAGHDRSLQAIKSGYAQGFVTKDMFTKVLRAYKAATDETKSDQRDQAAKFHEGNTVGARRGARE